MKKHFTTSVYILYEAKILLLKHPKLKKWLPPGGHLEENESPPDGAKREVKEETGLEIEMIPQENIWVNQWNAKSFERPFLCLIENIPSHKTEEAHQHLDLIYLARPIGNTIPQSDVPIDWFTLDAIQAMKSDIEIFKETQEVIQAIFQHEGTNI